METVEEYQRHLINHHEFDEDDKLLEPWCNDCGEPIDNPGQVCLVSDRRCLPSVEDLEALHSDVHDDEDSYQTHDRNDLA